jgi:hypothetical protein
LRRLVLARTADVSVAPHRIPCTDACPHGARCCLVLTAAAVWWHRHWPHVAHRPGAPTAPSVCAPTALPRHRLP